MMFIEVFLQRTQNIQAFIVATPALNSELHPSRKLECDVRRLSHELNSVDYIS